MITKTDQFFAFVATSGTKYFLWTQWKERDGNPIGFNVALFSGIRMWQGDVSMNSLTPLAEKAGIPSDEYISLAKEALMGQSNPGSKTVFSYDVKVDGIAKLSWKKQVASGKALFHLGDIDMQEGTENGTLFDSLLEHCSDRFSFLTKRVHSLQEENFRLSDDHRRAMERLTEAAQAKVDVEERLWGTFVDVLNAKKRKIEQLTLEVDELREKLKSASVESMDVDDLPEPAVAKKPTATKASVRSKHVEEENGEDTDEEKEQYEKARQENKARGPKLDDAQLILTHDDNAALQDIEERRKQSTEVDGDLEGDDALFVPKKRQRKAGRGGRTQQTARGVDTRGRQSKTTPASDSPSQSLDLNSPRQTRSSSGGNSMNLISKFT